MKTNKSLLALGVLAGVAAVSFSFVSAGTGCLGSGANCNTPTTVTVTLTPGDVCIGSEGSFDFGSFAVSSTGQTVTSSFANPFWVEDLRGEDVGYYTTVQMSGNLVGPGSGSIASGNVAMQANGGITTMAGSTNANVEVDGGIAAAYLTLDSARTLIKRDNAPNFGLIGQYGTTPSLQLVIPAFQAVGTYTGTLVYTLYEN